MKKTAKYFSVTFILSLLYSFTSGQNLVLNPSFEEYYHLPDLKYEYEPRYEDSAFICKHWHRVRGTTPDYYQIKAKNERYKIPCNMMGCHYTYIITDSAYMGFIPFNMDGNTEPFSGEFSKPLEVEGKYKVSFMYQYAGNPCYFYLDKIEVYISKDIKQFQKYYFLWPMYKDIITPKIKANVTFTEKIINDGEWHKITGYYTSQGGEQDITFGIFYQNEKIYKIISEFVSGNFIIGLNPQKEQNFYKKYKDLFIHQNSNYKPIATVEQKLSYYFIDDVSVEMVEDTSK
jgi:hypothetical protein